MNKLTILLCAVSAVLATGCKDLTPKQAALVAQVQCEVAAIAPYVEPALDAAELVKDMYQGKANYGQLGTLLNLSEDAIKSLNFELAKCRSSEVPVPTQEL